MNPLRITLMAIGGVGILIGLTGAGITFAIIGALLLCLSAAAK